MTVDVQAELKKQQQEEEMKAAQAAAANKKPLEPLPEAKDAPACPERLSSEKLEKKMKKVIKEGGKRGVEVEGNADMGGLRYFCIKAEEANGDCEMLVETMKAMNAPSDPSEEERKGGSGKIGKLIVSSDKDCDKLSMVAYVPHRLQKDSPESEEIPWKANDAKTWLEAVLKSCKEAGGGKVEMREDSNATYAQVQVNKDMKAEDPVCPLKFRDQVISYALNVLRSKGLFPEDNESDDDEMVFGDDDFDM